MNILEGLTVKHKEQGNKPVNIFVGRFQPFTLGHAKVLESLYKENKLPIVIFLIKGSKKKKDDAFKRPYSEEMQIQMLNKLKKKYPIEDVIVLNSPAIDNIFNALRPKYEPVLWGTGSDRMKAYGYQVNNEKYREDLGVRQDFSLYEIPRTGKNISATQVRNALLDDNQKLFQKLVPKEIHSMYEELKKVLEESMKKDGMLENKKQPKRYVALYEDFDPKNSVNEVLGSKDRSKVVVHLKSQGLEHGKDYQIQSGEFIVADMEKAKELVDAVSDKYKATIFNDRKRKDGTIPVMIIESENINECTPGLNNRHLFTEKKTPLKNDGEVETPTDTNKSNEDNDRMNRIQNNLDMIKQDLEQSSTSIEKLKFAIENGEKDKKTFETMSKLVTFRNKLLLEYQSLTKQLNK